ncbi:transposase [Streptomyces netropsis]
MIVDRHPAHRSKAVRAWLEKNAERIELHLMPGYSPELHPDELLNADLKHHVHATRATSADDLARETRRLLHRRQHQPRIACGYFRASHVRYTIEQANGLIRKLGPGLYAATPWSQPPA